MELWSCFKGNEWAGFLEFDEAESDRHLSSYQYLRAGNMELQDIGKCFGPGRRHQNQNGPIHPYIHHP